MHGMQLFPRLKRVVQDLCFLLDGLDDVHVDDGITVLGYGLFPEAHDRVFKHILEIAAAGIFIHMPALFRRDLAFLLQHRIGADFLKDGRAQIAWQFESTGRIDGLPVQRIQTFLGRAHIAHRLIAVDLIFLADGFDAVIDLMHIAGKGVVEYLKSVRELAHIFQRLAVDDHARIARDELLDAVFHVAEAFQQHIAGILILMLAQHRMRQSLDGAGIRPDVGIDVRLRVRAGPLLVIILEQAAVKVFPIFFLLRY